jgi:hypothetical protein
MRILALATVLLAAPAMAQWLKYPTAGIPRLASGKPDLAAPAPRDSGGKPDFSGIWLESDALQDTACPPDAVCIRQEPLPARAANIGVTTPAQFSKVMHGDASVVKTLLPYQPWSLDLMKQRAAANAAGASLGTQRENVDPHARCLPPNFPRAWALPQYKKIVQAPGLILILHEFNASYRQIFTDARRLPEDPQPTWNGYSSGKWEGDTLVVSTIGFRNDTWLDMSGSPLTEGAKVTERIERPNFGTLKVQVTVDDPRAYTKPWTVQMDQSIVVDTDLLDDVCLENEKDVGHYTGR